MASEGIAQGLVCCIADADAGCDLDLFCAKAVLSNPQARCRRREIASVIAGARDAEGLGQASGAGGKFGKVARVVQRNASSARHFFDAFQRFECAEKN